MKLNTETIIQKVISYDLTKEELKACSYNPETDNMQLYFDSRTAQFTMYFEGLEPREVDSNKRIIAEYSMDEGTIGVIGL